jgi:hypothetical protein
MFEEKQLKEKTPIRWMCSGPSGSGKTTFIKKLLCHLEEIFDKPIHNIVICYGANQKLYDEMRREFPKEIKFVHGFPTYIENYINNPNVHDLLIIDDLIEDVSNSEFYMKLQMKFGHHWNCSIITLLHNLFFQSKYLRTCSLQQTAFVLFKTIRGKQQIQVLGKQILPGQSKFLVDSFEDATKQPYSYLFINMSQECPDELRVRGNIFPYETMVIYIPKAK